MSIDTSLIMFKAISNFTKNLGDVFSDKHRPLKLYAHLINKTTIAHEKPIQKHIDAFREFCVSNREAISTKDHSKLGLCKIVYSNHVYINMKEIFGYADEETREVIWKHLLTISALVDPAGKAKQILKEQAEKEHETTEEVNFLTDIISRVEEKVDPNANPMEAISSIMQSGIFSDLVQGMGNGLQDGTLDLSKLMGTVQTMVTKLSKESGDSEGGEQAVNMINTMMANLRTGNTSNTSSGSTEQLPDLFNLLGPMVSTMMANPQQLDKTIKSIGYKAE